MSDPGSASVSSPGPDDPVAVALERARAAGERCVLATVLEGAHAGARLVVWGAGHAFGDLGWPRLNQRVALYAEQLLERKSPEAAVKPFDVPGAGKVAVRVEPLLPPA